MKRFHLAGKYAGVPDYSEKDELNLKGLKAFQERMVSEGNPSSGTMNKVLGEKGQVKFFREYVMPTADQLLNQTDM